MDTAIKKIPYGMTDFESIICDNYYRCRQNIFYCLGRKYKSFFLLRPSPPFREKSISEYARPILRYQ